MIDIIIVVAVIVIVIVGGGGVRGGGCRWLKVSNSAGRKHRSTQWRRENNTCRENPILLFMVYLVFVRSRWQ